MELSPEAKHLRNAMSEAIIAKAAPKRQIGGKKKKKKRAKLMLNGKEVKWPTSTAKYKQHLKSTLILWKFNY